MGEGEDAGPREDLKGVPNVTAELDLTKFRSFGCFLLPAPASPDEPYRAVNPCPLDQICKLAIFTHSISRGPTLTPRTRNSLDA